MKLQNGSKLWSSAPGGSETESPMTNCHSGSWAYVLAFEFAKKPQEQHYHFVLCFMMSYIQY